jgi:glycosyltransferase involved in cell wall biosynthesis
MARGLPVIAYDVAAVPGTLGDAGLLISRRDPAYVAAAVHELLSDEPVRRHFVESGKARSQRFELASAREMFKGSILRAVGSVAS